MFQRRAPSPPSGAFAYLEPTCPCIVGAHGTRVLRFWMPDVRIPKQSTCVLSFGGDHASHSLATRCTAQSHHSADAVRSVSLMATNKPTGDNARKGAVRKRTQL